jgi:hypothetical protein
MLYVSDSEDYKHYEHFGKIYNFRLYSAIPEEFSNQLFFSPPKIKRLYAWQESFFNCLSCGELLKTYLASKHQNLPAGGYVELELYECHKCKKYNMLEIF